MAGRESHLVKRRRVPGAHQNATTLGIFLEGFYAHSELVYALALVVVVHSLILSTEVTPLETVDRAKVPFLSVLETDFV